MFRAIMSMVHNLMILFMYSVIEIIVFGYEDEKI